MQHSCPRAKNWHLSGNIYSPSIIISQAWKGQSRLLAREYNGPDGGTGFGRGTSVGQCGLAGEGVFRGENE